MDESKESSGDRSSIKSRLDWIVRSWKVRRSFAFSLAVGIIAFLIISNSTGEQLYGIAVGVISAFSSLWILILFRRRQFLLLLSIGLGVTTAFLVGFAMGWYLFATVVGLMAFAVSLSVVVLYKRRAKVSLLFTACVLPAIVAILCWGWLQLAPYRKRSMAYEVVAKAKLGFYSIRSKEEGEWVCEEKGSIPSWLIKLSGEHATSQLKTLNGRLEYFQSADIYALDLEALDSVHIEKSVDSPELSPQLVEWLLKCPRLSYVNLDFATISETELALIERIGQCERIRNISVQLNLNHSDDRVDLSLLPRRTFAAISIDELSVSLASKLSGMKVLWIESQSISAEAIKKLNNISWLKVIGCTFDNESASAITEISANWILLDKCKFPNDFEILSAQSCERDINGLDLFNTHIQPDLLVQWLTAAKVNRSYLPRPTDRASEEQLTKQLSTLPDLHTAAFVSFINSQRAPRLEPVRLKR